MKYKPREKKAMEKIIAVRVSPEEHAQIKSMATSAGVTMSELIISPFIAKERNYGKKTN